MATSVGQCAPVFLPGEPHLPDREAWQAQSTGLQRVRHDQSDPAHTGTRLFLPVAALPQEELSVKAANRLACGDLAAPSVQGHGLPPLQELGPCQSLFFEPLVAGDQKDSLASLSVAPPVQALGGSLAWALLCLAHQHIETPPPPAGVLHCRSACRHLKGHHGWGPLYS